METKEHIIDIKSNYGIKIKSLFDILKDIIPETNLKFIKEKPIEIIGKRKREHENISNIYHNNGGIEIVSLTDCKTLYIYIKLNSKYFSKFYVKSDEHTICIDIMKFYNFLKPINEDTVSEISMCINKLDEHKIIMDINNDKLKTNDNLHLLQIKKEQNKINVSNNISIFIRMNTTEFYKICSEINNISEYMKITCSKNKIVFTSTGTFPELKKVYENKKNIEIRYNKKDDDNIIEEIYDLKNIIKFKKCEDLCDEVKLFITRPTHIKHGLIIKHNINYLGELSIVTLPVVVNLNSSK
jgi:hypothetical protein